MTIRTLLGFRKSGQPIWLARGGAPTRLEELRARQDAISAELRSINDEAGDGDLTPEQQTRWETLETEHTTNVGLIETEERAERVATSRANWRSTQFGPKTDPFDGRDLRSVRGQELRSRALAVVDDIEHVGHLDGDARSATQARVQTLLRTRTGDFDGDKFARLLLATENEHYRMAFMKIMNGRQMTLTSDESRALQQVEEVRAAMGLTDGNGGYAVPVLIDPTIILTGQGHPNDFFAISRVEDITNDEWRGLTSAGATSYWHTEAVTVTGGEPTIAQPTVPAKMLTTYIKWSFEIGGDWQGFASQMANIMGESQSEALVSAFTNGLGTTAQPTGVITALEAGGASFQVGVSTDGQMNPEDFYKLWAALPIKYRGNARWMMNTTVHNDMRQFGDEDPNFTMNMSQGGAGELFGRPVHLNDYMDTAIGQGQVTSASDVSLVVVGDFRNFLIANRVGATVETVQHVIDTTTGNPTGQRGTLMWRRIGSDSVNDNGFRLLTQD